MRVAWLLAVAVARAVAPGERLGSRSGRRAARASATESYAVLMYGHHGHTMGAVVLGTLLRRVDPDRARTALVANISAAAREALSSGGLWSVVESESFRRYAVDTEATAYGEVWAGRKLDLWALPFERVVYMDLDMMLLESPSLRRHLDGLFATDLREPNGTFAGDVAALRSTPHDCLNSGTMVLRPHPATAAAIDATVRDPARWKVACPGHDQKVLNRVFDGSWAPLPRWDFVKATMRCKHIPASPDALHFFADSAPWTRQCAACVAAGRPCSRRHHVDGGHEGIADCMLPLMFDAQRRWWAECDALGPAVCGGVLLVDAPGAVC